MKTVTVLVLLLVAACSRPEAVQHELRLGLVTGVTGPTAAWGEAIRRGAMLAVEDANARNVAGRRVELVVEDDQGRPEQTANLVEKLIGSNNVMAIVGGDTSGRTLAAAPICERARVPLVSPTASAPIVTINRRFTFRVCATDDLEAIAAAGLARERVGATRVAILRDTKNDYSVGMAATFRDDFARRGGTVTGVFDYAEGDSEFRAQLTSAMGTKPEALFVPGYYGDVAQIAIQARDLGITVPLLGGSGWDSPKLLEIGGKAIDGCWFVSGMRSASPQFVAAFRKRYGTAPDAANAQAYDAVMLLCDAVKRSPTGKREDVRDAIAATRDFPGASGAITIGPDNNARKPLAVFRVAGGNFLEEGTVR